MCGISAWISKNKIDSKSFESYNDVISHRGPDAAKIRQIDTDNFSLALGHRRLSIIDLGEQANQPMEYGNHIILFNGEIYNYIEIKNVLLNEGITFTTNSDTEVLLKAYLFWNDRCLDKLNGMFSFIIYDKEKSNIFFARDRFGIKPLYYYKNEDNIYFASEIKQFCTLSNFEAIGNINAIGNFLENRYIDYSEETFFKNVYQVKAGECGLISLKSFKMTINKWYNLSNSKNNINKSFIELFNDSINLRLRADVEIGSCLSGGIDSSSIVCLSDKKLKKNKEYTLQTFTSSFKDSRFDEREFVHETVNNTSIKAHYLFPLEKGFFEDIKKLTYYQDEPIWSSSIYAQSLVFKEAKNNSVKVMLDGQGADEVFCGYSGIFYPTYFKNLNFFLKLKELLFNKNRVYIIKRAIKNIINQKKQKEYSIMKLKFDNKFKDEFMNLKDHTLHFIHYHLPALLHYEDRNSMRYSIEARLPFLDYKLVEKGFNLNDFSKVGYEIGKKAIRESMRGITPDKILDNRVKKGFLTPQKVWINNNKELIIQNIQKLTQFNFIDNDKLEKLMLDFKTDTYNDSLIMRLYSLAVWIEVFKIKKVI